MKTLWLYVLALHLAFAQVKHGSTGVVYFTPDELIVAADSRGSVDITKAQTDNECKVATFGGDVVFVSVGAASFSSAIALIPSWKNNDEARKAYHAVVSLHGTSRGYVSDIAHLFTNSMVTKWSRLAAFDRAKVREVAKANGGELIIDAMIGGVDQTNKFQLVQTMITFDDSRVFDPVQHTGGIVLSCPFQNFCPLGEEDIAIQFLNGSADWTHEEAAVWIGDDSGVAAPDYNILRTMNLVHLTIKYLGKDDVGPPIDAVQLTLGNDPWWYQWKDNCPKN